MVHTPIGREHGDPRRNRNAIVDRRQFESQLFDAQGRPTAVMYAFAGRMEKEVGGLGPEARMAWAETVFNRCASRGHTLEYELRNNGRYSYWPRSQPEPGYSRNSEFVNTITNVCRNGTNLSLGATGNASLGVGVGRQTFSARGERFGVETPDGRWWQEQFGRLIRGVGRFIGDVVGAIGHVVSTVATGIVSAGRWVINGLGSLLAPQQQHTPHRPLVTHHQPRTEPHDHNHRPLGLVERMPQPIPSRWIINGYSGSTPTVNNHLGPSPTRHPRP